MSSASARMFTRAQRTDLLRGLRAFANRRRLAQQAARAAQIRTTRLFLARDTDGQREDREYNERAIRRAWSSASPTTFIEPTSRMNMAGWIVPRADPTTYPTVRLDPRRTLLHFTVPGTAAGFTDEHALGVLKQSQYSSWLATRFGLAKIRHRQMNVTVAGAPATSILVPDIYVSGAPRSYPHPLRVGGSFNPATWSQVRPTPSIPWEHLGSGCLPIFYMDCPTPFMKPLPGIRRNEGRYGDTVRSKFRELTITLEEFPFTHDYQPLGVVRTWNLPIDETGEPTYTNNGQFVEMRDRKPGKARVIIFARKKEKRYGSPDDTCLRPPIFPPTSAGAYRQGVGHTAEGLLDITHDTPSMGASVLSFPSSHPDSEFVILEDNVYTFPPFEMAGSGRVEGAADSNAKSYSDQDLFRAYGREHSVVDGSTYATWDQRATMSNRDADGLPHNTRKIFIKRRYKDMGHKISWQQRGPLNSHERVGTDVLGVRTCWVNPASNECSFPDSLPSGLIDVDMCDRELFVTVLTGAHLECHGFSVVNAEHTINTVEGVAVSPHQNDYGWRFSPYNVEQPCMVRIRTKWWYADEAISARPDQLRVVDAAGATIGRVVQDRPDAHLPGEVVQPGL